MADGQGLDYGLLGGMRAAKRDMQKDEALAIQTKQATQNLLAESLEIQDFIDSREARQTERRVKTKKLEAQEPFIEEDIAASSALLQAQASQEKLRIASMKAEEHARQLFHITGDNYSEQIGLVSPEAKEALGLTGKSWAEDGAKLVMGREAAINIAAHMRGLDTQAAALRGRASGTKGPGTTKLTKLTVADQKTVNAMLATDPVYKELNDSPDNNHKAVYRADVTALAREIYQTRQKQPGVVPNYSNVVQEVKAVADKYVTGNSGFFGGFFGGGQEFDHQGFRAEISQAFGVSVPSTVTQELVRHDPDAPDRAPEDFLPEVKASVPPSVEKGVRAAQGVITELRKTKNIGKDIPDHVLFNKLLEAGYINPDGSEVGKKEPSKGTPAGSSRRRSRSTAKTDPLADLIELKATPREGTKTARGTK